MIGCYIIYSEKLKRFYTGAVQDDLEKRIENHNSHNYGNHRYTAKADDWKLFLFIQADNYSHAIRMEKHIKKMKSALFIQNLKKFPELIEKLKSICLPR